MKIIRQYNQLVSEDRGATAAIGNFDGVHRGHLSVIELARDALPTAPLGIVTFEPHPRRLFQPDAPEFRLMSAGARASRLQDRPVIDAGTRARLRRASASAPG